MNLQTLYHLALTTHITGLTIMTGTTLTDFILFRQFWKQFAMDRQKGIAIRQATSKLPVLFRIGIILLVLSGVSMMAITNGVFGEQLWFRIKFVLIVLIVINGLAIGRRMGKKLDRILADSDANNEGNLIMLKNNIRTFQLVQMAMFLAIFSLSVFKFN